MLNEQSQLLLRVLTGPNAGAEALLASGTTVLGTAETSDLVLADPAVAAAHVRILVDGDTATLQIEDEPVRIADKVATGQTIQLADYQVFRLGGSSCAIGRRNEDWPKFAAADLLADAIVPPAAEGDETATPIEGDVLQGEGPGEAGAASEPASIAIGPAVVLWLHRRQRLAILGAASLAILLLAGAGLYAAVVAGGSADADLREGADPGSVLKEKLAELQLEDRVAVEELPNGQFLLKGYVLSSAELAALRGSLRELDVPHLLRVAALDRQKIAAETLVSQIGGNLSVSVDEEKGRLILSGFLPSEELVDLLMASLGKEIPGLGPVETRIDTIESVLAEVRTRLARDGLEGTISARAEGQKIRFLGEASDSARASLAAILEELSGSWGRFVTFADESRGLRRPAVPARQVVEKPVEEGRRKPAKPAAKEPTRVLHFTVIVAGENALVRDSQGRRYRIGDELPDGYTITEINARRVVATRDGKTRTYSHRR